MLGYASYGRDELEDLRFCTNTPETLRKAIAQKEADK